MNSAGVPYYGMLAFSQACAGCNQMLPVELSAANDSLTAYAFAADGKLRSLVIVNTDLAADAAIDIAALKVRNASVLRLVAPAPDSTTGVTLGDATVDSSGRWKARSSERIHQPVVRVPRMSAAVLHVTL
jgi:hypothetical protein